jgi:ATP-dependent Clp endopeptidase proteolytic subunit ClpP
MAEILLYDEIGYWGVTAQDFVTQLAQITAGTINVRINSPGGDVFDGLAIYQALKSHPATINTFVDGWAASAASFIALAGDTVTMGENAFMMIHKAWGVGVGNATDMRDLANTLDKIDGQLASIYAKKTGKSAAEMLALMAGESDGTWFTAAEAKAIGLADAVDAESAAEDANEKEAQAGALRRIANMRRRLNLAVHD